MATTIIKDGAWTASINPGETATFSTAQKYVDKNISVQAIPPTIGNGTVTITQNGTNKGSFTLNQSGNVTIELTDNNTWRGIQNNLTSDSTTDSLSAAQGKALKGLIDGKAAASHTHSNYLTAITKSMVTDALGYTPPTTDTNTWRPLGTGANDACAGNDSRLSNARPASDVHAWAKANNKPTYSYSEILEAPAIYSGTSTPDASLGKNGDIYIKLV